MAFADTDRIVPYLRSAIFSAPAAFAAGRSGHSSAMALQPQTGSCPICGAPFFSALAASRRAARATAPQWPCRHRPDRALFAEPLRAMVAEMRPFTAFVVIGLVVLIVVAFAVKLATTGLAP